MAKCQFERGRVIVIVDLSVKVLHAEASFNKAFGSPMSMYTSHERQKKTCTTRGS